MQGMLVHLVMNDRLSGLHCAFASAKSSVGHAWEARHQGRRLIIVLLQNLYKSNRLSKSTCASKLLMEDGFLAIGE